MIPRRTLLTRARLGVRWLLREGPWFGFSPVPLLLNPDRIDVDSDEYNPLVMADASTWSGADGEHFDAALDRLEQFHTVDLPCGHKFQVRVADLGFFAESYGFTLYQPNSMWQRITHAGSPRDDRALSDAWREAIAEGAISVNQPTIDDDPTSSHLQIYVNPNSYGDVT